MVKVEVRLYNTPVTEGLGSGLFFNFWMRQNYGFRQKSA